MATKDKEKDKVAEKTYHPSDARSHKAKAPKGPKAQPLDYEARNITPSPKVRDQSLRPDRPARMNNPLPWEQKEIMPGVKPVRGNAPGGYGTNITLPSPLSGVNANLGQSASGNNTAHPYGTPTADTVGLFKSKDDPAPKAQIETAERKATKQKTERTAKTNTSEKPKSSPKTTKTSESNSPVKPDSPAVKLDVKRPMEIIRGATRSTMMPSNANAATMAAHPNMKPTVEYRPGMEGTDRGAELARFDRSIAGPGIDPKDRANLINDATIGGGRGGYGRTLAKKYVGEDQYDEWGNKIGTIHNTYDQENGTLTPINTGAGVPPQTQQPGNNLGGKGGQLDLAPDKFFSRLMPNLRAKADIYRAKGAPIAIQEIFDQYMGYAKDQGWPMTPETTSQAQAYAAQAMREVLADIEAEE